MTFCYREILLTESLKKYVRTVINHVLHSITKCKYEQSGVPEVGGQGAMALQILTI